MMRYRSILTGMSLGALCFGVSVAQAQDQNPASTSSQSYGEARVQTNQTADSGDAVSVRTLFDQLDRNHDGVLSRAELEANPAIADAYDSFDTAPTIQQPAENTRPGGITYAQFAAGMQAASDSGAFGPAVSGGQRWLEYPDGSREPLPPLE